MALTEAQNADCRRFMGYGVLGATGFGVYSEPVYTGGGGVATISLTDRLASLSTAEESILTTIYLTPLTSLEAAVVAAGGNLDTNKAAVWERNPQEVEDRTSLFNQVRRQLCTFLGFQPGPGLGYSGSVKLTRG